MNLRLELIGIDDDVTIACVAQQQLAGGGTSGSEAEEARKCSVWRSVTISVLCSNTRTRVHNVCTRTGIHAIISLAIKRPGMLIAGE